MRLAKFDDAKIAASCSKSIARLRPPRSLSDILPGIGLFRFNPLLNGFLHCCESKR